MKTLNLLGRQRYNRRIFAAAFLTTITCLQITGCQKSESVESLKSELTKLKSENSQFKIEITQLNLWDEEVNQKGGQEAQRQTCIGDLKAIDAAKQMWAMKGYKKAKDIPTEAELSLLINSFPVCPARGTVEIGAVNDLPRCSVAGHEITSGYANLFRGMSNNVGPIGARPQVSQTGQSSVRYGLDTMKSTPTKSTEEILKQMHVESHANLVSAHDISKG
ncbi:MAG: hypothetical protein M3Y82_15170, partial [Verrucomicrobiota bacterium]|nr:hypothetical protein [Verrucomicrobiota bacterium]